MVAALRKSVTARAHDALIAGTAVHHGFALVTRNVANFKLVAALQLKAFSTVSWFRQNGTLYLAILTARV